MISKIEEHHRQRPAYIYVRQSTIRQVRHHRESTERQYALKNKAVELGWPPETIRILDRDLGVSGAQITNREDFKTVVADVSMCRVGAVFSLEASRLARSNLDWQRLIELCALTGTLVIDEDGIYDPADFNDGLLLGLKGTIAQAELHFLRARLQGGKLNKAKKGELRVPLPVGFCYDDDGQIVLDPDEEVQGAVRLVFSLFRKKGSAYGVVQEFVKQGLRFPKRVHGGAWAGRLEWSRLSHTRVCHILNNPCYAGVYAFGRCRWTKGISVDGEIRSRTKVMPMDSWHVTIKGHHEGYITWDEFLQNQKMLARNCAEGKERPMSGAAREGNTLLQGLLVCGTCGRRLTIHHRGTSGKYPAYVCTWRRREGLSASTCMNLSARFLDATVSRRILEVLQPAQIEMAVEAVRHLEERDNALCKQWEMRIERAEYEAQLAERRYMEIDPSNRLVAANLESRWNEALLKLEEVKEQCAEFRRKETRAITAKQKGKLLDVAKDFPRLWHASSTRARDRKRMLRLLIKDITVEKAPGDKQVTLHIRWQGSACEDMQVDLPRHTPYPQEVIDRVKELARLYPDDQVAAIMNREGYRSGRGKPFAARTVAWIRYRFRILSDQLMNPDELTAKQVAEKFQVSRDVVYSWLAEGLIRGRRREKRSPHWITMSAEKEEELLEWIRVRYPSKVETQ